MISRLTNLTLSLLRHWRRTIAWTVGVSAVLLALGFLTLVHTDLPDCPTPVGPIQVAANGDFLSYLAYTRIGGRGTQWALYVADLRQGTIRAADVTGREPKFVLSPSGTHLASALGNQLTVFDTRSLEKQVYPLPGNAAALIWRNDSQLLVQTGDQTQTGFWLIGLDGSARNLFTRDTANWYVRLGGFDPSGSSFTFTMGNWMGEGVDLYEMDLSSGQFRFLVPMAETFWLGSATTNGRRILLEGTTSPGPFVFQSYDRQLGVMLSSGEGSRNVSDAIWLSETEIAFTRYTRPGVSVWAWDVTTGSKRRLADLGSAGYTRLTNYPGGIGVVTSAPFGFTAIDEHGRQLRPLSRVCG